LLLISRGKEIYIELPRTSEFKHCANLSRSEL